MYYTLTFSYIIIVVKCKVLVISLDFTTAAIYTTPYTHTMP